MRSIEPALPLDRVRTMEEVVGESLALQTFLSWLLGIFGMLALVLAAVGTYGVLAYTVTERRREIGVRMALGAEVGQVVKLLMGQGVRVAGIGIAAGVGLALAMGRFLKYRFYGLEDNDPVTLILVAVFITLVAAVASYLPARRAARVDPVEVLREE
ncbi:MAG: FtsX-like permease family protein [Thermoanaerobaculia bacterium]|nr:FtsX-like permease family protein [Thermoanaerobaculia bacterium]